MGIFKVALDLYSRVWSILLRNGDNCIFIGLLVAYVAMSGILVSLI